MATNWDELRFGMPLNVWLMIDGRAQKHIRDLYERVDVGHAIIAQQAAELATLREALENGPAGLADATPKSPPRREEG